VLLSHALLRRFAAEQRRGSLSFNEEALRAIEVYPWPGNVRELLNAVKRAAIMSDGARVTRDDLGLPAPAESAAGEDKPDLNLRSIREAAERGAIVNALARSNGNIVKASEMLGVSRPTLYDLMHRLAIK
jgi:two-component system, NtrC family, response regulator